MTGSKQAVLAGRLVAAAVLAIAAAAPAAALPGLVTADGNDWISLTVTENPALAVDLVLPKFHVSYASTGDVLEDGGETGYLFPGYEVAMGMNVYAYAFSEPLSAGNPTSETYARGWFDDGVFATITNVSAVAQPVEAAFYASLELFLDVGQPNDRVSGGYSYRMRGWGDAASVDSSVSRQLRPAAGSGDSVTDVFATVYQFDLAPGGSYYFRIDDYQKHFFLHASAVPEPATWALMVTGFAAAGTALRRRRSLELHTRAA